MLRSSYTISHTKILNFHQLNIHYSRFSSLDKRQIENDNLEPQVLNLELCSRPWEFKNWIPSTTCNGIT